MIGQKFGRYTVLEKVKTDSYLCACECGVQKVVRGTSLRSGKVLSCGCYKKQQISKTRLKDLTGQTFGKLTVVERGQTKGSHTYWLCHCECGNKKEIWSHYLTSGITISCGCYGTSFENGIRLHEYAEENFRVEEVFVPQLTQKVRKSSTTGVKGVYYREKRQKYGARLKINGKEYFLGEYVNIEDAIKARKEAEEKYHKPYIDKLSERKNTPPAE